MNFSLDLSWVLTVMLIGVRLGIAMFATPFDAFGRIPARIRLFLVLALAVLLTNIVGVRHQSVPASAFELGLMFVHEVIIGLVLGLGVQTAFAAFQVAGRLLDFQSGLSAANVLNPQTHASEPLFGTILMFLGGMVFFLSGAHHLFLQGLVYSLQMVPPGESLGALNLAPVVKLLGLMFSMAMVLAAPVIAALLLVDVGIAVMARTMPQMNVYFIFLPLKVFLGVALTALTINALSPLLSQVFTSLFRFWEGILTVS